ncbi:hypothetical protein GCM10023206_02720 [Acinetobacter puyangensis]|uniref:Lipoprotein n=1 Tax=Acinetobacter puyangensis TaxID=1096779 RepID=A0A240E6I8_9GAMM|nr:hypothetical protein [Acinetobacter puyangensis]SNX44378.1 hypothetical protein SAMN05421731_103116 [Acinetobacter puyangensis]
MKVSISSLMMCIPLVLFTGCAEKKQLTPEEQWQVFCKSYEGAAYNIMFDRQNDISMEKSIEHLNKSPAGQQREMLIDLVKQAHQVEKLDQQVDKEKAMEAFKQGKYQSCLNTPH